MYGFSREVLTILLLISAEGYPSSLFQHHNIVDCLGRLAKEYQFRVVWKATVAKCGKTRT